METLLDCAQGVLVRLALLYWAASLIVLCFRLVWPDFEKLTAYGGHSGTVLSTSAAPPPEDDTADARPKRKGRGSGSSAKKKAWSSLLITPLRVSPLGTIRVPRRQSFTAFYVTGIATSFLLLLLQARQQTRGAVTSADDEDGGGFFSAVPLLLFALHCGVRLAETQLVQRVRRDDTVALFAAVAGSTFYAAAAVSSAAPTDLSSTHSSGWVHHSTKLQWFFAAGVGLHIVVQVLQVVVHTTLARLPSPTAGGFFKKGEEHTRASEEAVWRYVQAGLSDSARGDERGFGRGELLAVHGSWRTYRFPYRSNPVFQIVLDPHYTCEVLLYVVNTALMVLCILPHPLLPAGVAAESEGSLRPPLCVTSEWLSVAASVGVTVFTLLNLSITSAGHRRFWNESNTVRSEARRMLSSLLSASCASEGATTARHLPGGFADVAAQMLRGDLVEERLPRWNVVPCIW
jgi:hypothetical protein